MRESKLHAAILDFVHAGDEVLDVGAGRNTYHKKIQAKLGTHGGYTALDAHEPYLALLDCPRKIVSTFADYSATCSDLEYDVCLALDFVEHLPKEDAIAAIGEMQRIATRVMLFVPEGNHPQTTDYWKMGGDYWQTHRSTWYMQDLAALGFTGERWADFHADNKSGCDPGALLAFWDPYRLA